MSKVLLVVLCLLIGAISISKSRAQSYQYSRNWSPGKRSGSVFTTSIGVKLGCQMCQGRSRRQASIDCSSCVPKHGISTGFIRN
ncbi:hypothetical protein BV898_17070 [Hypsibius exemplaris]|uniref:Corazonin n=1 Tax=Hypsibius exemplaris TaxID=2072580 RepID=A0A9X6NEM5_HYPEX|nr:hypothetical protein BV898_17070 [Hypsibius exemplaris]